MLQTWDASGRQTLNLDTRIAKFCGVATIGWGTTGAVQSSSFSDSRLNQYQGCVPFIFVISGSQSYEGYMPTITISGNTIYWSYRYATAVSYSRPDTVFLYGIF